MAYIVKKYPLQENFHEFIGLIYSENLIGDLNLYTDYSCEMFYDDIYNIVINDKYFKNKPILKTVIFNFHDFNLFI